MDLRSLLKRIHNSYRPQEDLQDEVVLKFLHVLEKARDEELSCAEMFARMDEFVETQVQAKDTGKITPLVREHLDMCPECCDEYEALLAVLENTKVP